MTREAATAYLDEQVTVSMSWREMHALLTLVGFATSVLTSHDDDALAFMREATRHDTANAATLAGLRMKEMILQKRCRSAFNAERAGQP